MKVTFCGHKQIDDREKLKEKLCVTIEMLIKEGATEFLLGGYGAFDSLSAEVVFEFKKIYPKIRSILVVPYLDREYNTKLYDETEYPPIEKTPKRYAILKRNEYMVEKADVLVSHVMYSFGGAAKTRDYAEKKKKRIIDI